MKQPHKNAEILRAIADGDTIEWMNPHGDWVGFTDLKWRIKPKSITINGVECEAPVPFDVSEYRICISMPGLSNRFRADFANENATLAVFNALIKPFNETITCEGALT